MKGSLIPQVPRNSPQILLQKNLLNDLRKIDLMLHHLPAPAVIISPAKIADLICLAKMAILGWGNLTRFIREGNGEALAGHFLEVEKATREAERR
jgi:hypothetical protein